jgi:GDSL-like Lipase/Acylhydrolase family
VRLTFRTDSRTIAGRIEAQENAKPVDLVIGGKLAASADLAGKDRFRFENLAAGIKAVELWLPQVGRFRLAELELDTDATLKPLEDSRKRWITYGSSITHCGGADSPTQTWPAIVARTRGLNLTSLGFGGNCHLDPMVARLIRDLPADYLSMKVGINIYYEASLSPRTFRGAVSGTVKIIRERHPQEPFVVCSPIFSPSRETAPNAVGFTLQQMRDEIRAAVDALRDLGDGHLHYVDGLTLLGPSSAHLLPDGLHPSPDGYRQMGQIFAETIAARYFV